MGLVLVLLLFAHDDGVVGVVPAAVVVDEDGVVGGDGDVDGDGSVVSLSNKHADEGNSPLRQSLCMSAIIFRLLLLVHLLP